MKIEKFGPETELILNHNEADVAYAYLGSSLDTYLRIGVQQIEKGIERRRAISLAEKQFPDEDPVERVLREHPELGKFKLAFDHRVPLIGAYVLGAEGQEPLHSPAIPKFTPEEIVTVSIEARDFLLAAGQ